LLYFSIGNKFTKKNLLSRKLLLYTFLFIVTLLVALITIIVLPITKNQEEISTEIVPKEISESKKESECPKIDSVLNELLTSDNPLTFAEKHGLRIVDGRVQVMLTLTDEDTTFTTELDFIESIRSGEVIQGFVRIEQLCELANATEVTYIRVPSYAIQQ
jgi:cell division protein FtsL